MDTDERLINELFKNMNFENESITENSTTPNADLGEIFKSNSSPKSFVDACDRAKKAQIDWDALSGIKKSDVLHRVWEELKKKSEALPCSQYNLSLLADYFNLYSEVAVYIEKICTQPVGVVLVVLPPNPCYFIMGGIVSGALAAGCSVIVHTEQAVIPLFLEETLTKAGLPCGLFNVVTEPLPDCDVLKNTPKTIYCGSFSAVQNFCFEKSLNLNLNFICPNNTTALVLESCDINAAVSNILQKPWENASFSAVSTVVVQESIYLKFLDVLQFQIKQFLNINKLKLRDKEILEKFSSVILDTVKADGKNMAALYKENEWISKTLGNYENEKEDLPIFKILICRTPKEGVMLINNCYSVFGTSIWSEHSAQALEIASQLESPNVWINCHGIVDAFVPISFTHLNGKFVLGGKAGIFEYMSFGERQLLRIMGPCKKASLKSEVLQTVDSAKKAFYSWRANKNKKKSFKALADYLESYEKFSNETKNIKELAFCKPYPYYLEKNSTEEFFCVYEKLPVGVISLFISSLTDTRKLITIIALAIGLGNVVILVMEEQSTLVSHLIDFYNQKIQKNLLTAVYGRDAGLYLTSDPNVQALWVYDENVLTVEELRKEAAKNLKYLWEVNELGSFCEILVMNCTKTKIIWLPKVEKFP